MRRSSPLPGSRDRALGADPVAVSRTGCAVADRRVRRGWQTGRRHFAIVGTTDESSAPSPLRPSRSAATIGRRSATGSRSCTWSRRGDPGPDPDRRLDLATTDVVRLDLEVFAGNEASQRSRLDAGSRPRARSSRCTSTGACRSMPSRSRGSVTWHPSRAASRPDLRARHRASARLYSAPRYPLCILVMHSKPEVHLVVGRVAHRRRPAGPAHRHRAPRAEGASPRRVRRDLDVAEPAAGLPDRAGPGRRPDRRGHRRQPVPRLRGRASRSTRPATPTRRSSPRSRSRPPS